METVLTTPFLIVLLDFHFYFMTRGTHNSTITLIAADHKTGMRASDQEISFAVFE